MKNSHKHSGIFFFLIIILTLSLLSCGGGGGGTETVETNVALTADNAPQAAAGVLKAMDIVDALEGVTGLITTSAATAGTETAKSPLNNILNITAAALPNGPSSTNTFVSGGTIPAWYNVSVDCSGGGTIVISDASWDGPDEPSRDNLDEVLNFQGQVTFNSCKESTLTLNGSSNISVTGSLTSPTAATFSGSLTYYDSSNSTTLLLTNASVAVSNIAANFDMSNAAILASGTLQATINTENISIRCNNFTVQLASVSGGMTARMSGQVRSACLDTWLTISTATPVTLLSGDTCPTGGDVSASYNDGTIRVVIAADTSMNLYFNSSLVDTYTSCAALKGECP